MISIIVAKAQNNIIGGNNKLLWHISDDLKRFKEITSGNTIIMGRKTFESLPGVLPNRKHIILTRDKNFSVDFSGDTSFPQIDLENWAVDYSSHILTNAKDGLQYKFINYIKKS